MSIQVPEDDFPCCTPVTPTPNREELAKAYDSEAFEDHPAERRRAFAAIQWAARRKLAQDAADRVLSSSLLTSRLAEARAEGAAEAWDEGYTVGNAHNGRRDANPYRSAVTNEVKSNA